MRSMFNYGVPKSDIVMEEVINTEVGVQYKSFGLNLYNMDFSGKNLLITDVEKLIQMTMTTKDVSMFLLEMQLIKV